MGEEKKSAPVLLVALMLDLGNGNAIHIEDFDRNDVFNSSSISSFEFDDGMRWRLRSANDEAWRDAG